MDNPEFELLMTDAGHVKVHAHGSGARSGNQDTAKTKAGLNTKLLRLQLQVYGKRRHPLWAAVFSSSFFACFR
ncbi:hypothetical protein SDC9_114272 [bioreactor metagenome]|uniref:Uncharacterized protein n=1 Tax=bioreactor metagenome TaxID=1076179 RepID=A0A645BPI4_9ZZZZ